MAARKKDPIPALLFLLLVFSENILVHATDAPRSRTTEAPVLDIRGEELRTDTKYYIVPASVWATEGGGGVTLAATRNRTCPLDVVQEELDEFRGTPVTFSPVETNVDGVVPLSTDLNIKFATTTECPESTVWKVDTYDSLTGQWFVTTGGVEGNPGVETLTSWFKIEKCYGQYYKLVFCPSVCKTCRPRCSDVGRYYARDGPRRLTLVIIPFTVMFIKAEEGRPDFQNIVNVI